MSLADGTVVGSVERGEDGGVVFGEFVGWSVAGSFVFEQVGTSPRAEWRAGAVEGGSRWMSGFWCAGWNPCTPAGDLLVAPADEPDLSDFYDQAATFDISEISDFAFSPGGGVLVAGDAAYPPMNLPPNVGRPLGAPYASRNVNMDRAWQQAGTTCTIGAVVGGGLTLVFLQDPRKAVVGAGGGCAVGITTGLAVQTVYADQIRLRYYLDPNTGRISTSASTWQVCTDWKYRKPQAWAIDFRDSAFIRFIYPDDYPDRDLAGTTQSFARNCQPFGRTAGN